MGKEVDLEQQEKGGLLVKTEWESWTDGNDIPKVEKSLVGKMRKQHQKAMGECRS